MYRADANEDTTLLLMAVNSTIIAFRRGDGMIAWQKAFDAQFLGFDVRHLGPMDLVIHQGRVYVGARDRIVCLDYKTGALLGQMMLPAPVRRPIFLLDGPHLYVAAADRVLCLDHAGHVVWQTPHGLNLSTTGPTLAIPGSVRHGDEVGH